MSDSGYWEDRLCNQNRERRAFGSDTYDSRKLAPIADKNLEGTPDEGEIVKPS